MTRKFYQTADEQIQEGYRDYLVEIGSRYEDRVLDLTLEGRRLMLEMLEGDVENLEDFYYGKGRALLGDL